MYITAAKLFGRRQDWKGQRKRWGVKKCMILMTSIDIKHFDCCCITCFKIIMQLSTSGVDFCLFLEGPFYIKIRLLYRDGVIEKYNFN